MQVFGFAQYSPNGNHFHYPLCPGPPFGGVTSNVDISHSNKLN